MSIENLLNERGQDIVIESKTTSGGGHSGKKTVWTPYKTVKGIVNLFDITTRTDVIIADRPDDRNVRKIFLSYMPELDKNLHRVVVDGKPWKITLVDDPMGFGEFTKLLVLDSDFIGE